MVNAFHAGMWVSSLLYKVFAFSILNFVAQAKRVTQFAFVAERGALLKIIGGPSNWINLPLVFTLDLMFKMPAAFPSLRVTSLASRLRLATHEFPECEQRIRQFN
eukprot:12046346-Karenia_brevis.AAC.1